jgi:hypothetical protein
LAFIPIPWADPGAREMCPQIATIWKILSSNIAHNLHGQVTFLILVAITTPLNEGAIFFLKIIRPVSISTGVYFGSTHSEGLVASTWQHLLHLERNWHFQGSFAKWNRDFGGQMH